VLDLSPLYQDPIKPTDIRPEWQQIGFFDPSTYKDFIQSAYQEPQQLDTFIPHLGPLKMKLRYHGYSHYKQQAKLAQQCQLEYLFFQPLVASAAWHPMDNDIGENPFYFREILEIYPFCAIYGVKYRRTNSQPFSPFQKPSSPARIQPQATLHTHYLKLRKRVKFSLLRAFLPNYRQDFANTSNDIYLADTAPQVVIFGQQLHKNDLQPLPRGSVKGRCGKLDTQVRWYYFDQIATFLFLGDNLSPRFTQRITLPLKWFFIHRNHRDYLVNQFILVLQQLLQRQHHKTLTYSYDTWNKAEITSFQTLFNTFLIPYNSRLLISRTSEPLFPRAYQHYLFKKLLHHHHLVKHYQNQLRQLASMIVAANPRLITFMVKSCSHGSLQAEKEVILAFLTQQDPSPVAADTVIQGELREIIDFLLERHLANYRTYAGTMQDKPKIFWPCATSHQIIQNTSLSKSEIYKTDASGLNQYYNALKLMGIIKIYESIPYSHYQQICLNLDSPFVISEIDKRIQNL